MATANQLIRIIMQGDHWGKIGTFSGAHKTGSPSFDKNKTFFGPLLPILIIGHILKI
jgi:hypothetical protein